MPLSWGIRLRIAIGITRAWKNLKAVNVLLDEDLTPHICDCRLAVLKPLIINSARVEASKADNAWIVREYIQPVSGNQKDDIYAFKVLVLELLTGKYLEPREENSLVNWASSWLHDNESLDEMVFSNSHALWFLAAIHRNDQLSCYAFKLRSLKSNRQAKSTFFSQIANTITELDCSAMVVKLGYTDPRVIPDPMRN
ncbi:protein STRUBBELIG-receptor family 2 [Tanacetum coccineum]